MKSFDSIDESIYYNTMVFTPEEAAKFLEERSFENNRYIRKGKVGLLAQKIKSGRYKDNGTPSISVAKDGKARNGHHTLLAVVKSGCAIRLRVAWNIPDDTFDTFDTGSVRTAADILTSKGHANTPQLAALLRPVIRWERGVRSNSLFSQDGALNDPILPSDYEDAMSVFGDEVRAALAFAQANKGSVSGSYAGRIKTRVRALFNAPALGLAHYVLQAAPGGEKYLIAMTSGADLQKNSPALSVRNYFTASNPKEIAAVATILRGYRRTVEGLEWIRVDASKYTDTPRLWEV